MFSLHPTIGNTKEDSTQPILSIDSCDNSVDTTQSAASYTRYRE